MEDRVHLVHARDEERDVPDLRDDAVQLRAEAMNGFGVVSGSKVSSNT